MWADNEAEIDLLGFDFLLDELVILLTEPRMLPLTVGLLGDWGSGKSSLLALTERELEAEAGHYVVVRFSPWQFEGYDDIKVALMNAILDRLGDAIPDAAGQQRVGTLRRLAGRLRRPTRTAAQAALPAAATAAAGLFSPELAPMAGQVMAGVVAGPDAQDDAGEGGGGTPADDPGMPVQQFRGEFARLLADAGDVDAVVVLIDDLDRCLPETVVETFEAIRLFLNAPKTAYVIAAHQKMVEMAIDARYFGLGGATPAESLGAQYLEKMLQHKIAIPTLSAPEAETYLQVLLAELHLSPERFADVVAEVKHRRAQDMLDVHFNHGIARAMFGANMPIALHTDLAWAAQVAPVLGSGLRGNPRQTKRFLNTFMLRMKAAQRRGTSLDAAVLAKLMVLEDQHIADFRKLFDWQVAGPGASIPQLAQAEAYAAAVTAVSTSDGDAPDAHGAGSSASSPPAPGDGLDSELRQWADAEHVRRWLRLEPRLGNVDLRPYFTYARDRLTPGAIPARLSPQHQELLAALGREQSAVRRNAVGRVAALPADERATLLGHLMDRVAREPDGDVFVSAVEIAQHAADAVAAVCAGLAGLPHELVPYRRMAVICRELPAGHPEVEALLSGWQASTVVDLARAATHFAGRRTGAT